MFNSLRAKIAGLAGLAFYAGTMFLVEVGNRVHKKWPRSLGDDAPTD